MYIRLQVKTEKGIVKIVDKTSCKTNSRMTNDERMDDFNSAQIELPLMI